MNRVCLLFAIPLIGAAQTVDKGQGQAPEETDLPKIYHCGSRADLAMTQRDRVCYWWTHSLNTQSILGAAFNSGLDTLSSNRAKAEWGDGWTGFGRRFGSRMSQSMAKGTGEALANAVFHQDPRFYESRKEKFWPRLGFALAHTVIAKNDKGEEWPAAGRIAGAFSSGFVGMAWTPDSINTVHDAFIRSGTAMGGSVTGSLWKEFQPDIMHLFSSMFSKRPKTDAGATGKGVTK